MQDLQAGLASADANDRTAAMNKLRAAVLPHVRRARRAALPERGLPRVEVQIPVPLSMTQAESYRITLAKQFEQLGNHKAQRHSGQRASMLRSLCSDICRVCDHPYTQEQFEPEPDSQRSIADYMQVCAHVPAWSRAHVFTLSAVRVGLLQSGVHLVLHMAAFACQTLPASMAASWRTAGLCDTASRSLSGSFPRCDMFFCVICRARESCRHCSYCSMCLTQRNAAPSLPCTPHCPCSPITCDLSTESRRSIGLMRKRRRGSGTEPSRHSTTRARRASCCCSKWRRAAWARI